MQKYLELLLELLRPSDDEVITEQKKLFLAIGEKIQNRGNKSLQIHHRCGFIFSAYNELLLGKKSLDEFLATGDITSKDKIISGQVSSLEFLQNIIKGNSDKNLNNSLIILDSISFLVLSKTEKEIIQTRAKDNNSELVFG